MAGSLDPSALTRTDTFSQPLGPSSISTKANAANLLAAQGRAKAVATVQRIDLEPLYANLKAAIGEHWAVYKEAFSLFVLGSLNQAEFSQRTAHFLTIDPSVEHLHNQLVAGIFANIPRDIPDNGPVAPWVSANDKPSASSKPVSGDGAEQRLKTEVMQLPARDRRRIKDVPEPDVFDPVAPAIVAYNHAKQFRNPDAPNTSTPGFSKTNVDLEIRKRYAQPLAAETGEFPDTDTIHGRMVPICFEEGLPNGAAATCATFLATATEQFVKEILSIIYSKTRSNMPNGSVNSVMTHRFRKQLAREEDALLRGEISRGAGTGLLPVEAKEASGRPPLGLCDVRLALDVGGGGLGQFPMVMARVMSGYQEGEYETLVEERRRTKEMQKQAEEREKERERKLKGIMGGAGAPVKMNGEGAVPMNGIDLHMEEGADDGGWDDLEDMNALGSLLDDCLAVGQ